MSYVHSIYVLCPGGSTPNFQRHFYEVFLSQEVFILLGVFISRKCKSNFLPSFCSSSKNCKDVLEANIIPSYHLTVTKLTIEILEKDVTYVQS